MTYVTKHFIASQYGKPGTEGALAVPPVAACALLSDGPAGPGEPGLHQAIERIGNERELQI